MLLRSSHASPLALPEIGITGSSVFVAEIATEYESVFAGPLALGETSEMLVGVGT